MEGETVVLLVHYSSVVVLYQADKDVERRTMANEEIVMLVTIEQRHVFPTVGTCGDSAVHNAGRRWRRPVEQQGHYENNGGELQGFS
jgi:hypothetical protein